MPPKSTTHTGKQGEEAATAHLESKGWRIAERNWRSGKGEVDIIAWETERLLVFVEVKTRSSQSFGPPESFVDEKKQRQMARTAGAYMEAIGYEWAIRFDVVSVMVNKGKVVDVQHFEDVFFPIF
jgi:putative endonuclease